MAIQAMNIAIKNNRKLLPQRDRLKNRLSGFSTEKKTQYNLPKATAKQLKAIRKRLKEERKIRMMKVTLLTIILFFGLICVFAYSADGIVELLTI